MAETKLYFVEMKVRFAVFEGKMEAVLTQVIESIQKMKDAKGHQPLLTTEVKIEQIDDINGWRD